jgi:FixJ family two-component response regulator
MSDKEPAAVESAIVIGHPKAAQGVVRALVELLAGAGVQATVVATAEDAAARLVTSGSDEPPCVLVDVSDVAPGDVATAAARVAAITETVPLIAPIVVASAPSAALITAVWRAGAGDLYDPSPAGDGPAGLRTVLARVAHEHFDRQKQRRTVSGLRAIVEDFFRDLVRTERRSIDLEHRLNKHEKPPSPTHTEVPSDLDHDRDPTVFLVEDDNDVANQLVDELEGAGLVTFAFLNGEDAVKDAEKMARKGQAIDLALVDLRLPGIDGLETVRRLRARKPGLAAFLMTGYSDVETATTAADLGVVGFVLKPFDDVPALVARIREQAHLAMTHTREHHYLQRIKERHERVLSRYRKLAAEIDG